MIDYIAARWNRVGLSRIVMRARAHPPRPRDDPDVTLFGVEMRAAHVPWMPLDELNVDAGLRGIALNRGRVVGLALPPLNLVRQRDRDQLGIGPVGGAAGNQRDQSRGGQSGEKQAS